MGVMALRTLFKDVQHSIEFAQIHLNMGFPAFFKNVEAKHLDFAEKMTDADKVAASTTMAEMIIRRGLGPKHWAGASDIKDYKELVNLKDVDLKKGLQDLAAVRSLGDLWKYRKNPLITAFTENKGFMGLVSIGTTAYKSALSEIGANSYNELGPEFQKVLAEEIASAINAQLQVNGDTAVTVNAGDILKAVHGN